MPEIQQDLKISVILYDTFSRIFKENRENSKEAESPGHCQLKL